MHAKVQWVYWNMVSKLRQGCNYGAIFSVKLMYMLYCASECFLNSLYVTIFCTIHFPTLLVHAMIFSMHHTVILHLMVHAGITILHFL